MMNVTTAMFSLSCSTNVTATPLGGYIITWKMAMVTLITVPLSAITIIGNILVIVAFQVNPLLRTVSNYFLLSLAVADLILGTISMNLYTTYIVMGRWTLGSLACDVWLAVDYVASNASVMNLLVISFDRYLSITRPLTYRVSRTNRRAALFIALAWGISFLLWAPAILFWQHIVGERTVPEDQCAIQFLSEPVITFGTAIAAFYLPVSVMVGLYWRVYQETERRSRQLAGLIASRGGDSNKSSQSQSSNSYASDLEETRVQVTIQPEPEESIRTLSPSLTQCTAAWWKKSRIQYTGAPSHTVNSPTQTGIDCILNSDDGQKNATYIPLAQITKRMDLLNDSDVDSDGIQLANCQSDSQQSLRQCPTTTTGASPLSQTVTQKIRKPRSWSLIREKKAARTLCAILLAFIVTWTPYNIMVLVSTFCEHCVPERLWQLGYWLCYVNSTVNPVCYAFCNKHFQITFKALLFCRWREQRKGKRWTFSQDS
ncbi:muscarinic acetylcholine receptor M1 [Ictalurus punctatus]|uniref:Muscarinic acetylcholine receptor n=1 Tax=Ictalurus punctatus TaxID=7998 RepID=A0A2D0RHK7_ICTPU|nr:muscarinic acetylcholine receptor M1 [Ictalurus punctatus]XP_053538080.1 muscarinic acetylcholine receptor M1 [Ictalurus punctatus]